MITKTASSLSQTNSELKVASRILHMPSWLIVMSVGFVAGIGNGWAVISREAAVPSPFLAALTMMLAAFVGWYAWAFFTHLVDKTLFGVSAGYRDTLDTFARAYAFQSLGFFSFVQVGTIWVWVGAYLTIVAWAIIAPRRLGMRTWQAVVAATLGMLVWLACLLAIVLVFQWDGAYVGIGAFLA